jgi:hypothetical protein
VATAAPQVSRQLGKAQVNRGWQNIPQAQAQQLQRQFAQQAPAPKNLPAKPTLPVKPQIQAATKPGPRPPNTAGPGNTTGPGTVNPPVRTEVSRPTQLGVEPGAPKPVVQSQAGTPGEPSKTPQTAGEKKPEVSTAGNKPAPVPGVTLKPFVNEATKGSSEPPKLPPETKLEHPIQRPAGHGTPPKPKSEETKKPTPDTSASQPAQPHAVVHHEAQPPAEHNVAVAHNEAQPPPAEHHAAAADHGAQPPAEHHAAAAHDSNTSHHGPPPNQKKKPEQKD